MAFLSRTKVLTDGWRIVVQTTNNQRLKLAAQPFGGRQGKSYIVCFRQLECNAVLKNCTERTCHITIATVPIPSHFEYITSSVLHQASASVSVSVGALVSLAPGSFEVYRKRNVYFVSFLSFSFVFGCYVFQRLVDSVQYNLISRFHKQSIVGCSFEISGKSSVE